MNQIRYNMVDALLNWRTFVLNNRKDQHRDYGKWKIRALSNSRRNKPRRHCHHLACHGCQGQAFCPSDNARQFSDEFFGPRFVSRGLRNVKKNSCAPESDQIP